MREPKFLLALLPPSFWGRRAEGPQSQIESRGSVDWGLLRIWTCGAGSEAVRQAEKSLLGGTLSGCVCCCHDRLRRCPKAPWPKSTEAPPRRPRARDDGRKSLDWKKVGRAADNIKMWTSRPTDRDDRRAAPRRPDPRGFVRYCCQKSTFAFACSSFPSTVSARTLNLSRGSVRSSEWVDRGRAASSVPKCPEWNGSPKNRGRNCGRGRGPCRWHRRPGSCG